MQSRIKVWYKSVGVQRVAHAARWAVTLDGRALQTPAKSPLELPTEAMAWAVAMEWQAQGKFLQPYTMPLMKLATTSIDQVPSIRPQMASSMLRTMHTDVVALRADAEDEPELAAKEAAAYDPLISWLADAEGVQLNATSSLVPPAAAAAAARLLGAADDWTLAALDSVTGSCKSFVLALALYRRRLSARETDLWGEVEAGHDLDRADLQVRVIDCPATDASLVHGGW
ncbi:ATP12 chaperone protein [Emiliania huxleyi CCMP1516]|uniref:ATP12 chaperone protein n=2 Tax=Emiliania huxleyi TaxID=2903 RepID=A0A0D3K1I7_EMIH1|nr:ATP12 chaperone protein [Emiliania huxleyi CCMP1516]EOD29622.1 ATP12 chaperone protein [Emiliania huxleyi CCMP1516]|eukprot:XP_005782051.1 ATP12 chaperone protein [Emiliania huxleyi CCMP1516]